MLETIFVYCIFPLISLLTVYITIFIHSKIKEINSNHDNELGKKYLSMLGETVSSCVLTTSQTYVESLKKQGSFDAAAQKQAFEMTYNAVIGILSDEAKVYLETISGDLNACIINLIEAEVNKNK